MKLVKSSSRKSQLKIILISTFQNLILLDSKKNASIESMKTTSMETVSTGVLDKNKEQYLWSKEKAKQNMIY